MENEELNADDIAVILEALKYAKLNINKADYGGTGPELNKLRNENLAARERALRQSCETCEID